VIAWASFDDKDINAPFPSRELFPLGAPSAMALLVFSSTRPFSALRPYGLLKPSAGRLITILRAKLSSLAFYLHPSSTLADHLDSQPEDEGGRRRGEAGHDAKQVRDLPLGTPTTRWDARW
jgi:hypothetical protein